MDLDQPRSDLAETVCNKKGQCGCGWPQKMTTNLPCTVQLCQQDVEMQAVELGGLIHMINRTGRGGRVYYNKQTKH